LHTAGRRLDHGGYYSTPEKIDGMMSMFDDAGVEKQIQDRDGVASVNAKILSGAATIIYGRCAEMTSSKLSPYAATTVAARF
jgi:hypothetical protein